jgi:hypothetical protein
MRAARREKIDWRTRAVAGRVTSPRGATIRRPRASPAITRIVKISDRQTRSGNGMLPTVYDYREPPETGLAFATGDHNPLASGPQVGPPRRRGTLARAPVLRYES